MSDTSSEILPSTPPPSETSGGMFGLLRYVFALMVVLEHLGGCRMTHAGYYAVYGFFILSGYLMTLVWKTHYAGLRHGYRKYMLNRFLRVYPSYWAVLLFALPLVALVPRAAARIHAHNEWPVSFGDWSVTLLLVGIVIPSGGLAGKVPMINMWSIGVELVFWALIPELTRSRNNRILWLGLSLGMTSLFFLAPVTQAEYFSLMAASLPFCLGAWLMHRRSTRPIAPVWPLLALAAMIAYDLLASPLYRGWLPDPSCEGWRMTPVFRPGFYIAIAVDAGVIYLFSRLRREQVAGWCRRLDALLGDLAYPIFLIHLPAGILLHALFPNEMDPHGWPLFTASLVLTHGLAWTLWWEVDRPVSRLRLRNKQPD